MDIGYECGAIWCLSNAQVYMYCMYLHIYVHAYYIYIHVYMCVYCIYIQMYIVCV
jgi:hypothetical protein